MEDIHLALMLQSIELGKLKTTAYTDECNGIQKSEFQVGSSVRSTKPYFPDIITDGVPERCAGAQSEQMPFFFIISFYFMQCLCFETWSVPPVKISCCSCLLSSHRPAIQISADAHVFQSLCTGKQLDLKLGPLTGKISTLDLQSFLLLAYKHQRQLAESDVNSTSTYRALYSSAVMLAYLFMN